MDLLILSILSLIIGFIGFAIFAVYYILYTLNVPIDSNHGGQIVARMLKKHDVKHVFALCGGHISPILVSCKNENIEIVTVRDERNAAFAADAYGKISGNIGVVCVTAGPGITNTVTAIQTARLSESPLLLIGGASASFASGRGSLQDVDQISMFKSICKQSFRVTRVKNIASTIAEAIFVAKSGAQGPVFVELPINILYPYKVVRDEAIGTSAPKSLWKKTFNYLFEKYIQYTFVGAFPIPDISPIPVYYSKHSKSQVQKTLDLLKASKNPVIVIGTQLLINPSKDMLIRKILNDMAIPVFQTSFARGLMGKKSHYSFKFNRNAVLRKADFVLLLGVYCDFRMKYGQCFDRKTKVVIVNRDTEKLYMNQNIFWNAACPVHGDSGEFLEELYNYEKFEIKEDWKIWAEKLLVDENAVAETHFKDAENIKSSKLVPEKIHYALNEALTSDHLIVCDGGDFVGSASYILTPHMPRHWLDPGPFGSLGVGAGYALGAYKANPSLKILIIFGDCAVAFSLVEFTTLLEQKVPVVAVIGNDQQCSQIKREQSKILMSDAGTNLFNMSFDEIIKGLGCEGHYITQPYINESNTTLNNLFKLALMQTNDKTPTAYNCIIEPTSSREGSISV